MYLTALIIMESQSIRDKWNLATLLKNISLFYSKKLDLVSAEHYKKKEVTQRVDLFRRRNLYDEHELATSLSDTLLGLSDISTKMGQVYQIIFHTF